MIVSLTSSAELTAHLAKNAITLVDFWAPWCGPCKVMNPILDQLANDQFFSVSVVKVNIDDAPDLASGQQIISIPCLKIFVNGQQVASQVGAQSLTQLKDWISRHQPSAQHPSL
jgi:thioredoxin